MNIFLSCASEEDPSPIPWGYEVTLFQAPNWTPHTSLALSHTSFRHCSRYFKGLIKSRGAQLEDDWKILRGSKLASRPKCRQLEIHKLML